MRPVLVKAAGIPSRFQGKTFDNYKVKCNGERVALSVARDYAENFRDHFAVGRCLIFCGRPGTGKTHLACAIAKSIARSGRSARYTTVLELIREIRFTWGNGSFQDESSVMAELTKLGLLVIDEVGVQFERGITAITQLTELIDLRYRAVKPTLVISNYPASELGKYLGDRGADRLRENGGKFVKFDWESYRGQNERV